MTDPTSEPAADWAHLFHVSQPPHQLMPTSNPADPTHVITGVSAVTAATSGGGGGGKPPPRKRPRASRRAPTTLLNTSTANFRAMVQQFTGIPSGPYSPNGLGLGFGPANPAQLAAIPLQERQYCEYRPPLLQQQEQQQEDVMRMGFGMNMMVNGVDDGRVVPGFFYDGLGHGYSFN